MSTEAQSQRPTPTPVIVWCHPRSVSTAFERAWHKRADTRSYHEPLSMPFYYGKERACRRYNDEECHEAAGKHWNSTIEGVLEDILSETESGVEQNVVVGQRERDTCRYIFIKDMAQYVFSESALRKLHPNSTVYKNNAIAPSEAGKGLPSALENPTVLPIDLLRRFKHTFLMRTPKKSVPSYYKCVQDGAAGFTYFDAAEAGFVELKLLYDWIANPKSTFHTAPESDIKLPGLVQSQPLPPPLVDASDLLADPDTIVKKYCDALGVPFEPSMLTWESGNVSAFNSWQGYHTAAENSTGFKSETPVTQEAEEASKSRKRGGSLSSADADSSGNDDDDQQQRKKEASRSLPAEVSEAISENMDPYNYLFALRSIKRA